MQNILIAKIDDLMTSNPITVNGTTIMTEVKELFEKHTFHHIPVLDDNDRCVGILSKSDYYQLQDVFTRLNLERSKLNNERYFKSLIASEVMSKEVISMPIKGDIYKAIDIFLENKVHSIIITENEKCVGIITPYDILEFLNEIKHV